MSFPTRTTNWNKYQPRDLKDALRACKDCARDKKRYSVERIAELMGVTPDSLYKWMSDGRMPVAMIPAFEHVTGAHFVTEYLAAGTGRIVIKIPAGHPQDAEVLADLQSLLAGAMADLIKCYAGRVSVEQTVQELTATLQSLAWHRENVVKLEQPELDLGQAPDEARSAKAATTTAPTAPNRAQKPWTPGWMARPVAPPAAMDESEDGGHA